MTQAIYKDETRAKREKTLREIEGEFVSDFDHPEDYYDTLEISPDQWRGLCKLKDKTLALFDRRWHSAMEVIDLIARRIGIDPETSGLYLYGLIDGESPLAGKIDEYFDRSGDKVKLKRAIDDLERENAVLRSLIKYGAA
jgi:hypothetical protein